MRAELVAWGNGRTASASVVARGIVFLGVSGMIGGTNGGLAVREGARRRAVTGVLVGMVLMWS
jgi:hypothetical protein